MSARDELYELAVCGDDRTANQRIDAYRAEVLREAADAVENAFYNEPFLNYPPDFAAHLRELAGKDTGGAPAGESTQPATDDDDRVMRTVRDAIEDFDFAGYGLDDVDPRSEYAEWVGDLASAITGAIGGETA